MAIGPDARHSASGRIVVITAAQATIGVLAAVMGLGPWIDAAAWPERVIGTGGLIGGAVLLASAALLTLRRGPTRTVGVIGGLTMGAIGLAVTLLAISSYEACSSTERATACYAVIGVLNVVGLVVTVLGGVSVTIIRRAPRSALHRARRGR